MQIHRLLLVILGVSLLVCSQALAEKPKYIPASEVKIKTPVYEDHYSEFSPTLGEYKYRVAWQGIGAAYLNVYVDKVGDEYHITAKARTNSFIDVFYKLRYHATGVISATNFSPKKTLIDQRENSKIKQAQIEFLDGNQIHTTRWRDGREEADETFDPENFMLDPFSAGFLARSLNWELGQTRTFDTYVGKSRYLISLKAEELVEMKIGKSMRNVWVVVPHVKKLTSTKPKQKLREAKIYVTADDKREIIKIVSEVFVGSVTTKLVSITPANRPEERARLARAHLKAIPRS